VLAFQQNLNIPFAAIWPPVKALTLREIDGGPVLAARGSPGGVLLHNPYLFGGIVFP